MAMTYNEQALNHMVESIQVDGKKNLDDKFAKDSNELKKKKEEKERELKEQQLKKMEYLAAHMEAEIHAYQTSMLRNLEEEKMKKKNECQKELKKDFVLQMSKVMHSSIRESLSSIIQKVSFTGPIVRVQVGSDSEAEITADFLQSIALEGITFSLDSTNVENDGGCILNDNGILYNLLFSSTCEDLMEKYAPNYMNELSAYE